MLSNNDITSIFVFVDDFFIGLAEHQKHLAPNQKKRGFPAAMKSSEVITICLLFQFSGYRNFKTFYQFLKREMSSYFPKMVSYSRFVTIKKDVAPLLYILLTSLLGESTGISFVDSTPLSICKNKRIPRNKVFKNLAKRGKSSMGWFFGFKLHIVINHQGEIISFAFTEGNVDDRKPVEGLCKKVLGKLFGDRGYISTKLFKNLMDKGVQLITNIKANMKNKLMPLFDKLLLRKRFLVETTFGILKEEFQLEHSRHRSHENFIVNLLSTLTAYCLRPKKPTIKLEKREERLLARA